MSLVVYHDGLLAVDRSGLDIRNYSDTRYIPCDVLKLYVSKDKKIAVAYSGNEIDFGSPEWHGQVAVFRRVLSKVKGGSDGIELQCVVQDCFSETTFMVMTSQACFELVRVTKMKEVSASYGHLHPLNPKDYSFLGSGLDAAEFLISTRPDISIDELFKLVSKYCSGMWSTPTDKVHRSELIDF